MALVSLKDVSSLIKLFLSQLMSGLDYVSCGASRLAIDLIEYGGAELTVVVVCMKNGSSIYVCLGRGMMYYMWTKSYF